MSKRKEPDPYRLRVKHTDELRQMRLERIDCAVADDGSERSRIYRAVTDELQRRGVPLPDTLQNGEVK